LDQDYHQVITESNEPVKLLQIAREKGFVTMFQDGLKKCTEGLTTLEEVYRVTNVG
jgi:type II secretory ATPase GspE/PulE/Tfp pilus assembly ATPase PilB-like protein